MPRSLTTTIINPIWIDRSKNGIAPLKRCESKVTINLHVQNSLLA